MTKLSIQDRLKSVEHRLATLEAGKLGSKSQPTEGKESSKYDKFFNRMGMARVMDFLHDEVTRNPHSQDFDVLIRRFQEVVASGEFNVSKPLTYEDRMKFAGFARESQLEFHGKRNKIHKRTGLADRRAAALTISCDSL